MSPSRVCLLLGLSEVHGLVTWPGIVKTRMFLLKDQPGGRCVELLNHFVSTVQERAT
jgi:hypothetical protein